MGESKYFNKKNLCKYELSTELFDKYDLKVENLNPVRNVYILATDKGNKILKKIDYSVDEIEFINSILKYIKKKFSRIMDFMENNDGKIYTQFNGKIYCIMDLVEGRECDYNNPYDIILASKALGELHRASEGFKTNYECKKLNGKAINNFMKKKQELKIFSKIAQVHENKTEFDMIFLENLDYYVAQVDNSINYLDKSFYYKLSGEEDKIAICHHDLAHHNIIIKDLEAYFVDFDYSMVDLKVHDLCNFINKVEKSFNYDIGKAEMILSSYKMENTLDFREIQVLYGLLLFPEDFYQLSRDYYAKRKDWEEDTFLEKLKKKINYENEREIFLNEFFKSF